MTTEAKAKITQLHNKLALALRQAVTSDELKRLLYYFLGCGLERREQESIDDFLDLWQKLDIQKIIEQREYSKLEDAFNAIHAPAHLQVIKEFQELMKSEDGLFDNWIKDDQTIGSVEELTELMKKYEALLPVRRGVVLNNAVFRHITSEGGELQLRNGTAKLQVPRNAIRKKYPETFWIFRAPAESKGNLRIKDNRASDIIRCSLPFRLGPAGLSFKKPVILTLGDHSLSKIKFSSDKPMSIYRKEDGGKSWTYLGSCFCDTRNLSATAQIQKFSSYVLGLPATVDIHLLNVHVLVGYKLAEDMDVSVLSVYFLMNEYSYVSEFVEKNKICVITEACLYLDTQKDVNVAVVSQDESILKCLRKDQLRGLAEFPVQIDIPRSIVRHDENATLNLMQDEKLLHHCLPLGTTKRKPNSPDTDETETSTVSNASATMTVECDMSDLSEKSAECDKMEVDTWKEIESEKDIPVSGCAIKTNRSVDEASASAMYMPPHKKLAPSLEMHLSLEDMIPSHKKLILDLEMQLTSVEIRKLKRHFIDGHIASRGDLKSVPDDILQLFPLLQRKKIIEFGEYGNLKDALKAIGETESVHVIEKFEAKIKEEAILLLRRLASALEKHLTSADVKRLKCYFKDCEIASRGDLDSVPDDILELLSLLEQKKIIEPGKYCKLKDALKSIDKMDCIRIIEDFEKEIKHEAREVDVPTAKYMKGSDSSGSASAYSKC